MARPGTPNETASGASLAVDTSRIRKGDVLTIRCKAYQASGGGWSVKPFQEGGDSWVRLSEILAHEPRSLEAGDRVWGLATKCNGTVRATYQNLAWVEFEDGRHEVCFPHQVERHQ